MRLTKKKGKMVSNKKGGCKRDWGAGMACAGLSKRCTIVPENHFGPIPGVPVGSLWKKRLQVSFDPHNNVLYLSLNNMHLLMGLLCA